MAEELVYRQALPADLESIEGIIEGAKRRMASLNIDQWQDGYPARADIRADILACRARVLVRGGEVVFCAALSFDGESTYDVIRGRWSADMPYAVIHRCAVRESCLHSGISGMALRHMEREALQNGFSWLRIDTHEGNTPMKRFLQRNGYTLCGTIFLQNGAPRLAYDKKLSQ